MMGLPKATAFDKAVAEGKDIERQQIENDMLGGEERSMIAHTGLPAHQGEPSYRCPESPSSL